VQETVAVQYTRGQIAGIWATAALPMAALSWGVAPWLAAQLEGPTALPRALLVCVTAGLVWQFVLVMFLVHRERGSLGWPVLKDALWLQPPRSPSSGRAGGRLWLWVILCVVLVGLEELIPTVPIPAGRDLGAFLQSDAGKAMFAGGWGWFTLFVALAVFNTVLGEELLFRGLLLPRMQGAFGRGDWAANGILFAVYHVHVPWAIIPTGLVDTFAVAYPSRRYRSALFGIIVHSAQSVLFIALVLALVLQ